MTPAHVGQLEVEYATPLEDDEDHLDAYYDDDPLWYLRVVNILGEQSPPNQPERLFAQLHLMRVGELTTYVEARGDVAGAQVH